LIKHLRIVRSSFHLVGRHLVSRVGLVSKMVVVTHKSLTSVLGFTD